jgi:hypothetical protein
MPDQKLTSAEKDLLVKLLGKHAAKMEKLAKKADDEGQTHVLAAAKKQKTEADVLLNKIL